jgi:hypothetical protein
MVPDEYIQHHKVALTQALNEFEAREHLKGFEPYDEASNKILDYLATNNMPPTLQSVETAVREHVKAGYKLYLSADETNLRNLRAQWQNVGDSLAVFDRWYSFQHIEKNPRTEAAILTECQGHGVIDKASLDLFLGRAASKGLVTFSKAPGQDTFIPGQYSGKDIKDTVDVVYDALGHRIYSSKDAPTTRPMSLAAQQWAAKEERERAARQPETKDTAYWQDQAERAAQAQNHARKLELSRIVITNPDRTINWEQTAKARKRMQDEDPSR